MSASSSVNLVPLARLQADQRLSRRNVWIVVVLTGAACCAAGWTVQHVANKSLARLTHRVNLLNAQRSDVQRRLVDAEKRRAELLDRLRTLVAARRPQPWPERLLRLTREAPEGVFLTSITAESTAALRTPIATPHASAGPQGGAFAAAALGGAVAPTAGWKSATSADANPAAPDPPVELQSVQLRGYAASHGALLQFLNTLQRLPGWRQVDLVQATQAQFGAAGQVIAFEFDCRAAEESP